MKLAGLQKLSLVDFPGCLASVIFVQGCNFRCPYCQNPDLVALDKDFNCTEEEVLGHILKRKDVVEGVVITGGEPSVYSDLPELVERIKNTGVKVKLDINGANPGQLKELLAAGLIDYVALDIKTSLRKYSLVTDLKDIGRFVSESIRIIMDSAVPYEFRTTCAPGIVDKGDFPEIGKLVKGARKYCLQQFRPFITLDEDFRKVKPYSKENIGEFGRILSGFVEKVEIRGI